MMKQPVLSDAKLVAVFLRIKTDELALRIVNEKVNVSEYGAEELLRLSFSSIERDDNYRTLDLMEIILRWNLGELIFAYFGDIPVGPKKAEML